MDGLRIYYNFIGPHSALDGKTPAQQAKIESDKEWMSLRKQVDIGDLRQVLKALQGSKPILPHTL
jgi:hypothetical protein